MSLFTHKIRVYIEDTDVGGIVYYVNYLKFMERARTEYIRSKGIEQREMKDQGYLFVVKSVDCDYILPAKLDDLLTVSLEIVDSGAASVTFRQEVSTDEKLCTALVKLVCVKKSTMKPVRFPQRIKQIFAVANN